MSGPIARLVRLADLADERGHPLGEQGVLGRGEVRVSGEQLLRGLARDFQEPGVAEKEFDADPPAILSRLYLSPDSPREAPQVTDPKRAAGGWIPRLGAPKGLPSWLTQEDLDYYVAEFTDAGFRGAINLYRNWHRNWEITPELTDKKIPQPVHFIAGAQDAVIRGAKEEQLRASMGAVATDLRGVTLIQGAGHWVQQEKAAETNATILDFLASLKKSKT